MSVSRIKTGLAGIASEVLEDVRKEAEAIVLQARTEAKEALKMAKDDSDKIYKATLETARTKIQAEKRRIEALTEVEVRNRLLQTKETIVDAAFEKAQIKINEFVKTEAYHEYLLRFIKEAVGKVGTNSLIVRVNAQDKFWLQKSKLTNLSKNLQIHLELAEEPEGCVGGCKIQTPDGKIVYDNTVENRLRQLKSALRVEIAQILFRKEANRNAS